jgi:hypothetical protein
MEVSCNPQRISVRSSSTTKLSTSTAHSKTFCPGRSHLATKCWDQSTLLVQCPQTSQRLRPNSTFLNRITSHCSMIGRTFNMQRSDSNTLRTFSLRLRCSTLLLRIWKSSPLLLQISQAFRSTQYPSQSTHQQIVVGAGTSAVAAYTFAKKRSGTDNLMAALNPTLLKLMLKWKQKLFLRQKCKVLFNGTSLIQRWSWRQSFEVLSNQFRREAPGRHIEVHSMRRCKLVREAWSLQPVALHGLTLLAIRVYLMRVMSTTLPDVET